MLILTLNCGSSSVKYQLYNWEEQLAIAKGEVQRVGSNKEHPSFIEHLTFGKEEYTKTQACKEHTEAIKLIIDTILDPEHGAVKNLDDIKGVGHRIVHGGEKFRKSTLITEEALKTFNDLVALSPLHNPANISGIKAAMKVLPDVPHAAIMDTAWHQSIPKHAFLYALPYSWYREHNVRKYGFHGTSFLYTAKRASVLLNKDPMQTNLIIAHIGNGASMCAVKNGESYDTTMGLTPLQGLIMGTRCGDIDPAIIPYMMNQTGMSASEVDAMLNKKSGIFGLSEENSSDRRELVEGLKKGDERSALILQMEGYRIKKYIGSFSAALGRVDAVVFTAGAGEMSPWVREFALQDLGNIGIKLDKEKNMISMCRNWESRISADDSPIPIFIIPTDEELVMTEDTVALMEDRYDVHTHFEYSFQSPQWSNKTRKEALAHDLEKKPQLKQVLVNPPL